jgi:hypothetical protein
MVIQESALKGGKFSTSDSTIIRNDASTCDNPCVPGEDYSTAIKNNFWDITHTFNLSSKGERLGREPSALVQHT